MSNVYIYIFFVFGRDNSYFVKKPFLILTNLYSKTEIFQIGVVVAVILW